MVEFLNNSGLKFMTSLKMKQTTLSTNLKSKEPKMAVYSHMENRPNKGRKQETEKKIPQLLNFKQKQ